MPRFREEGERILSKFTWGHAFLEVNETLLKAYALCESSEEVVEIQNEYLKQQADERKQRRRDRYQNQHE
jgi:pre-rRNA-processing protein TSR3